MIDCLFKKIPSCTFEAFAVGGLIALAVLLIFRLRKQRVMFWILLSATLFMFAWRMICHEIMVSSRYAAILIFPAVIFTVWACFKMEPLARWLLRKTHTPLNDHWRFFCKFIPYFFVIGLGIACFGKMVRFNPHWRAVPEICRTFQQLRQPGSLVATNFRESWIAFYGDYDIRNILKFNQSGKADRTSGQKELQQIISLWKNYPGTHFIFWEISSKAPIPSAETLGLRPEEGTWELISSRFNRRQERERLCLFRFTPKVPNIGEWKKAVSQLSPENRCWNGGFEAVKQDAELKNWMAHLRKSELQEYLDSDWLYPSAWELSVGWWNRETAPQLFLSDKSPLAGKYSLRMRAIPPRTGAIAVSNRNKKGRYTCSLFIRGEGRETTSVSLCIRGLMGKPLRRYVMEQFYFRIEPGKLYRVHCMVSPEMFPEGLNDFQLQLISYGDISVDQVQIIPDKKP